MVIFDTNGQQLVTPAPGSISGFYRSAGLAGVYNAASPTTKYDVSADVVQLWRPSDGSTVVRTSTGTLTCDKAVAGPAANGRDQAAAFSISSWVYLYFIWNGSTLATIFSATAPPTGPTLPTGYTHWAFVSAHRIDSGGNFIKTYLRGTKIHYELVTSALLVNAGSATTETTVDASGFVPPIASVYFIRESNSYTDTSAGVLIQVLIRLVTGVTYDSVNVTTQVANVTFNAISHTLIPNIGQAYIYLFSAATGTRATTQGVLYFEVPNGAL